MQQEYDKRDTVPNTAHGNEFHILQAMYFAFWHAYMSNIPFEMHLEDHGFGDFDDLILMTHTGVSAFQFKHHLDSHEQGLNDFVTANKKDKQGLVLHRYFDSIYQSLRVDSYSNISYFLCTNNTLPWQLKYCVDEKGYFKSEFYEAATPSLRIYRNMIYASILKFSVNLSELFIAFSNENFSQRYIVNFLRILINEKNNLEITDTFFDKIWDWIKGNFPQNKSKFTQYEKEEIMFSIFSNIENGNWNISDQVLWKLIFILRDSAYRKSSITFWDLFIAEQMFTRSFIITNFLKKLCFRFGQYELAKMEEEVKLHIQQRFKTKNDVLYYAFYYEFRSNLISRNAVKIDAAGVSRHFQEWMSNYIHLERLFGLSFPLLGEMPTYQSGVEYIPRPMESNHIIGFIQNPNHHLLVVSGLSGMGKSTLVKHSLKSFAHSEGEFLFLDTKEFSRYLTLNPTCRFESMLLLKLLVLDDADSLLDKDVNSVLLPLLRSALIKNIKLILITTPHNLHNLQALLAHTVLAFENLTIAPLNSKIVLEKYQFLQAVSAIPNIETLMCIPFYLVLIFKFYTELSKISGSKLGSEERLKDYLISLAIKKPTRNAESENNKQNNKQRKSILRRITYSSTGCIPYEKENSNMNFLVNDNVLIIINDQLSFSHSLFQNYFVRNLIDKLLRDSLETNEPLTVFFEALQRRLSHHYKFYAGYLLQNPDLTLLVKKSVDDTIDVISPFSNVLVWSYQKADLKLSRYASFLIRSCAWNFPMEVIKAISLIIDQGRQIGLDDEEVYGNLVLALQITLMQPEFFSKVCEIILFCLSRSLIPEKVHLQLSEEFPQLFCHCGRYFPLNYDEKLHFLKKHLKDDIFSLQYILEGLYYAANPAEKADLNQALESELSHRNGNTRRPPRSEVQDKYSLEALDILLDLMDDNIDIEVYIMKILDHTLGATYVSTDEWEVIQAKTDKVPVLSDFTPYVYSAPVYILTKKRLPQWIVERLEKKILEVLKEDQEMLSEENNVVYGKNYHKHSFLIHQQINEIRTILSSEKYTITRRTLLSTSDKNPEDETVDVLDTKESKNRTWARFDFKDETHAKDDKDSLSYEN